LGGGETSGGRATYLEINYFNVHNIG
jgi:hypothetical protein